MKITVSNENGESIRLSNTVRGYRIREIDGLSPADANIATTNHALNDGSIITNRRIPQRNIVIDFYLVNPLVEKERLKLYQMFRTKEYIRFDYETALASAFAEGYLESFEAKTWQAMPTFQLSILCPDPYFYSDQEETAVWSYTASGFQFPLPDGLAIPEEGLAMSTVSSSTTVQIQNNGIETGFTFTAEFTGQASFVGLLDTVTDEYLTVGYHFKAGDILTVTTSENKKSITIQRNGETMNAINQFATGSTWLRLRQGTNRLRVRSDALSSLNAEITFREKYAGV